MSSSYYDAKEILAAGDDVAQWPETVRWLKPSNMSYHSNEDDWFRFQNLLQGLAFQFEFG